MKKELINYIKSLGVDIHLNTQARGHQGFFVDGRIDISKKIKEDRIIPTILHEFAHYIHSKLEGNISRTGGSLEVLFQAKNSQENLNSNFLPEIKSELIEVTQFVDENSLCLKLFEHKKRIKKQILDLDKEIKREFPSFQRSKKFKEFNRYIRWSKAKCLLKYDRVCYINLFSKKIYSTDRIEEDFPEMPKSFVCYIRLNSLQRKQKRVSARINKLNKYYERPTELFARFVEGLYLDKERVEIIAPQAFERFNNLLNQGYYLELQEVLKIL